MNFQNLFNEKKTFLIFGITSGIGKELYLELQKLNVNIIGIYKDKRKFLNLKKRIINRKKNLLIQADISKEKDIMKIKKIINRNNFKIKYIINCAGIIGQAGLIENTKINSWKKVININLFGVINIFKHFIKDLMKIKNSVFINFSGGGGTHCMPMFDAYASTKASITRITENISLAYKKNNICICAVSPGPINTQMFNNILSQGKKRLGHKVWKEMNRRKKNGGIDINIPTQFILNLLNIKNKSIFHGRTLSAVHDDLKKIVKNKDYVKKNNIFTIRRLDGTNQKKFF
jgi:short-subunit dehydrogenase